MLNTHWILEEDMRKVSQYREMEARIIQIEREWISVPFHWSAQQLAHVEAVSLAFQAIAQAEIDWRLKQYNPRYKRLVRVIERAQARVARRRAKALHTTTPAE